MRDERVTADWLCRECGRDNRMSESRCAFCSAPRPGATEIATAPGPAWSEPAEMDEDYLRPLSPSSNWRLPVFTAISLIIACGLLIVAEGVGLALLLALIPALVFLFRVGQQRLPELTPLPPAGTTGQFFAAVVGAIGVTFLVVVSALITFTAVCLPTGIYAVVGLERAEGFPTQAVVWTAGLLGGMALAGAAGYGIVYAFFHRKKGE